MRLMESAYYRNFAFVLRKKIPVWQNNSSIMKKFRDWSSMSTEQAKKVLRFDSAPDVQVMRIVTGHQMGTAGWKPALHFTKKGADDVQRGHIAISSSVVGILEGIPLEMLKGKNGRSAKLAKAGRDLANFVASLVMHELVHYGNFDNDLEEPPGEDFGAGFQKEAHLDFPFPKYFLQPHAVVDSPAMMRRELPPESEYDEVFGG